MKKLLSIAAIAALMTTGANADNEITQTLTILPSAVVQFGTPIAAGTNTGGIDKFIDYSIDFGSNELGATPTHQVDVYVQTNVKDTEKVQMTITDTVNSGKLATADVHGADIVMAYAYGTLGSEQSITLGTAVDLTAGENSGGVIGVDGAPNAGAVGSFTATPTIASDQLTGVYTTTLAVSIQVL